jgi:hypothetical protein
MPECEKSPTAVTAFKALIAIFFENWGHAETILQRCIPAPQPGTKMNEERLNATTGADRTIAGT